MDFCRFLMVVLLTLSASLTFAMDAGHSPAATHDHAGIEDTAVDQPPCCVDSSERGASCHVLLALLPADVPNNAAPEACGNISCVPARLATGIEPSGPLDPPRAV